MARSAAPDTGAAPRPTRLAIRLDAWLAPAATALLGCGLVAVLAGAVSGDVRPSIAGAVAAAVGLGLLLVAGWVDRLVPLAIALPWPALYSTDALRPSPAAAVTGVVLLAWALGRGLDRRPVRPGALPVLPTLALFGAVALAAAFAAHPLPAARELTTIAMLLGLLVVATDELGGSTRRAVVLASVIAVVAGAGGALAMVQALGGIPSEFPLGVAPLFRANLGFGGPTELAMYFALSAPFAVFALQAARTGGGRLAAALALAGVVLGLAATFSRGSWLAVLAASAVLLPLRRFRLVAGIGAAALVAIAAMELASPGAASERLTGLAGDWTVEQRAAFMLSGTLMFAANPVLGVGPGGFAPHLDRYGAELTWFFDRGTSAHNTYIHMAAETGVIGLAALLLFLGAVLLALYRRAAAAHADPAMNRTDRDLTAAVLWGFAIACAVSMVEWSFAHGIGQLVMLVAAMGLAARPAQAIAGASPAPLVGAAASAAPPRTRGGRP